MAKFSTDTLCPTWGPSFARQRIHECLVMLNKHGFVTDAERKKIQRRIYAWEQKGFTEGKSGDGK